MRKIAIGFVIGILVGGIMGGYIVSLQYTGLKGHVDQLQLVSQTFESDFNEFYLEILYYQARGMQPVFTRLRDLYLPVGILYEEYLKYPDRIGSYNISITRVSKYRLREELELWQEYYITGKDAPVPYSGFYTTIHFETLYIWKWGTPEQIPRTVEVLWWSPRENLPWS